MTIDWNSPSALAAEYSAFINQQHALCGVYIWELVLGFGFDWHLLKRQDRRPWSSIAKWLYFGCRYVPMMTLITLFVGFQAPARSNCKAWVICVYAIGFSAIGFSSALLAIRANALWNRSIFMTGASSLALAAQASGLIYQLTQADGFWSPATSGCASMDTEKTRVYITITFLVDIFLLVSMFLGLTRQRGTRASGSSLWRTLWHQGLIWLALATIAHVPSLTVLWLNLNQIMNEMFFTPEWMILAIVSARMYRSLLTQFTTTYNAGAAWGPPSRGGSSGTPEDIPLRPKPMRARHSESTVTGVS